MRKLVYATSLSLDGYIDAEAGDPSWVVPDEELHRHFNDIEREIDTLLYGRRMYELMAGYWPTADQDPSAPGSIVEYAQLWRPTPKVVFSSTLESVDWNSRLVRGDAVTEVAKLKAQPGRAHGRRRPHPGFKLGICWPNRRVSPLLCPNLPGFGQGSLLPDSEQGQAQAGGDPHLFLRHGPSKMRPRQRLGCV